MRRLGTGKTVILLIVLVGLAACTRSLSGPAPTAEPYQPSTPVAAAATSTQAPTVGKTVIAAETPTPIPTMTPTPEVGAAEATATNTPEPTTAATATPTTTPSANEFSYTVQTGDTLWGLALRFGTTVEEIKARNGLASDTIYKGESLIIPGTRPGSGQTVTHIVQPGETLSGIALKYGTTIQAISAANSLVNPSLIYVGQELTIPTGGGTPPDAGTSYHIIQPGETLSGIALRYGTTPWAIAAANGISNINYIYAGHTLRIP